MFSRRSARISGATIAAAALVTLTACAAEPEAPEVAESSSAPAIPTPSVDPTAAAMAAAAADEKLLPLPVDEIGEWAKTAVPGVETEGHQSSYSGWLSEHSSPRLINTDRTIDAGTYQVQLACRGEGTITVSVHPLDTEPDTGDEPIVCQNSTIAFDASTPAPGLVSEFTLDGAPTIYALSFILVSAP